MANTTDYRRVLYKAMETSVTGSAIKLFSVDSATKFAIRVFVSNATDGAFAIDLSDLTNVSNICRVENYKAVNAMKVYRKKTTVGTVDTYTYYLFTTTSAVNLIRKELIYGIVDDILSTVSAVSASDAGTLLATVDSSTYSHQFFGSTYYEGTTLFSGDALSGSSSALQVGGNVILDLTKDGLVSGTLHATTATFNVTSTMTVGNLETGTITDLTADNITVTGLWNNTGNVSTTGNAAVGALSVTGALTAGTADIAGALTADSTAEIKGAFTADSTANIKGALTADTTAEVKGKLTVSAAADIGGKLTAGSDVNVSGTLNLTNGNANHIISGALSAGSAAITGALTAGSAAITNALTADSATVSGNVSAGSATIAGTLSLTGATAANTISGSLNVKDVSITNSLAVTGATILGGTLGVTGATTVNGSLTANKDATFQDTLTVTNGSTLKSILGVEGATTLGGTLGVSGATTMGSTLGVTGATTLGGTLGVTGDTTLSGGLTVSNALTTLNNGLTVTGALATMGAGLTVTGATALNAGLTVSGAAATLKNGLTVTGASVLNEGLTVTGASVLKSTLDVTGATALKSTADITGAATFGSTLGVTGLATIGGTLGVTGNTTLSGGLTVAKLTTLTGNLSVTGDSKFTNIAIDDATVSKSITFGTDQTINRLLTKPFLDPREITANLNVNAKFIWTCAVDKTTILGSNTYADLFVASNNLTAADATAWYVIQATANGVYAKTGSTRTIADAVSDDDALLQLATVESGTGRYHYYTNTAKIEGPASDNMYCIFPTSSSTSTDVYILSTEATKIIEGSENDGTDTLMTAAFLPLLVSAGSMASSSTVKNLSRDDFSSKAVLYQYSKDSTSLYAFNSTGSYVFGTAEGAPAWISMAKGDNGSVVTRSAANSISEASITASSELISTTKLSSNGTAVFAASKAVQFLGNNTYSGSDVFSDRPSFASPSNTTSPFLVSSTVTVANLSADYLDGSHGTDFLKTLTIGDSTKTVSSSALSFTLKEIGVEDPLHFKGITASLPATATKGDMYKANGAFSMPAANSSDGNAYSVKVGDTIIAAITSSTAPTWYYVPSGDDIEDTWRPVYIAGSAIGAMDTSLGISGTTNNIVVTNVTSSSTATATIDLANILTSGGSYGPSANQTPDHGGSFTVPYVTYDKYGRITGGATKSVTLPAQYVHPTYARTDTASTAAPAHSETFTAVDSITSDNGHITKVNTKTVTMPAIYVHPAYSTPETDPTDVTLSHSGSFYAITGLAYTNGHLTGFTKQKYILPAIYTLPAATNTALGGIMLKQAAADATINGASTTASRFYPINLTTANVAYVNVPWTDTVYTHPTPTRTDGTDTGDTLTYASGSEKKSFAVVSSVRSNTEGHITGVNTKTVTIPDQYVHPTFSALADPSLGTQTPTFGGTFNIINSVTRNTDGHITALGTGTVKIPSPTALVVPSIAKKTDLTDIDVTDGTSTYDPASSASTNVTSLKGTIDALVDALQGCISISKLDSSGAAATAESAITKIVISIFGKTVTIEGDIDSDSNSTYLKVY